MGLIPEDGFCQECGAPLPEQASHVYGVQVMTGRGRLRWFYSVPCPKGTAEREAGELRATGYKTRVLTAAEHESIVEKRPRGKKARRA